jgi:hypothetical protein
MSETSVEVGLFSDEHASKRTACNYQKVRKYLTLTLAAVGVAGMCAVYSKNSVSEIGDTGVKQSWDTVIDTILKDSKGNCDRVAMIGLDGTMWTSQSRYSALKLTHDEASNLASAVSSDAVTTFATKGISIEGIRYIYLSNINGEMFFGKLKGFGGITLGKTTQAIFVAHTPELGDHGTTNLAVRKAAQYYSSMGMRRLSGDSNARRLSAFEEGTAAVVELGSGVTRAGFSGEDEPKSVHQTQKGLEASLEDVFFKDLSFTSGEKIPTPVLVTEASLNPQENREMLTKIVFETFNAPLFYLANNAVLAMYAAGRTTGVVLHIDDKDAFVVPVYEGHALPHATIRLDFAGQDFSVDTADGLFQPGLIGRETTGIHETVYNSVMKCDVDLRKDLYANVILAGSGTLYPGLKDRLDRELKALAPHGMKIKIVAPHDRDKSTWIGGSILGSSSEFSKKAISNELYGEVGPSVVGYKCF